MADVFISHHTKSAGEKSSEKVVPKIAAALDDVGVTSWYSPSNTINLGSYASRITSEIKKCQIFLLVHTAGCDNSEHVRRELNYALQEKANGSSLEILCVQVDDSSISEEIIYWLGPCDRIKISPDQQHIQEFANRIVSSLLLAMRETIRTHEETIRTHEKTIRAREETIRTHEKTIREQKSQIQQLTRKLKKASKQRPEAGQPPERQQEATSKPEPQLQPMAQGTQAVEAQKKLNQSQGTPDFEEPPNAPLEQEQEAQTGEKTEQEVMRTIKGFIIAILIFALFYTLVLASSQWLISP